MPPQPLQTKDMNTVAAPHDAQDKADDGPDKMEVAEPEQEKGEGPLQEEEQPALPAPAAPLVLHAPLTFEQLFDNDDDEMEENEAAKTGLDAPSSAALPPVKVTPEEDGRMHVVHEEEEEEVDASPATTAQPPLLKIVTREDDRMHVVDSEDDGLGSSGDESCSGYDSYSSYESDDSCSSSARRRKRLRLAKKEHARMRKKATRKGLPTQAEIKEAEDQDPEWAALETFTRFLRGTDPEAAEALAYHLRPRDLKVPYGETQVAAIRAKAATLQPTKPPKPAKEVPKPYKKIRRMVFHESMNGKHHIFKDVDASHDHQCSCLSVEEAQAPGGVTGTNQGVLCDENCLNRSLNVECSVETCRFAATGECKNQRIGTKQSKEFRVFRTEGRGWGVQAVEDMEPGNFLVEYVGEVIDDEEVARRLWQAKQEEGDQADFYMVEAQGVTVDAKHYGNEARFINHSCEPNCQLQKWVVNGTYRLGIFAIKPIKAGEECAWDYNFSNFGEAQPKECRCGAATCRKVLAGKGHKDEAAEAQGPVVPVSVREEKMQRAVSEAEAFRQLLHDKPLADMNALVLFFNARTSRGEMELARRNRLWVTRDGKSAKTTTTTTKKATTQTTTPLGLPSPALEARLEAALAVADKEAEEDAIRGAAAAAAAASSSSKKNGGGKKKAVGVEEEKKEDDAAFRKRVQAKVLGELAELAAKRAAAHTPSKYQPRRRGLLSLREKRWQEAEKLPFAEKLVGGKERVQGWHESRWQAMSDMIVFMKQSETRGLWTDFNEDICYSCGCEGDLICCDACTSAFHVSCAGLYEVPEESQWFCNRCRKGGRSGRTAAR